MVIGRTARFRWLACRTIGPMARVAVIFTGGTIAMRQAADGSGATPTLRGADLLASVPGLGAITDV